MKHPSVSSLSPPLLAGLAGREEFQESPRDPAHADISNQARSNPIQGRSMPPTQHESTGRSEKERISQTQGWMIPETVITDNTDGCSSGPEPLTIDLIPASRTVIFNATGSAPESYFTKVGLGELALLAQNTAVCSTLYSCALSSL